MDEGERDAAFEHGREVAAADFAYDGAVDEHAVVLARRLATVDGESPQPPFDAPLLLRGQRGAAAEIALGPRHDPAESRLQRRDTRPELVAVQRQSRFEPQGVAGTEPGGRDAGVHDGSPEP